MTVPCLERKPRERACPDLRPIARRAGRANHVTGLTVEAQSKGRPPPADVTVNMQASDDDLTQMVTIWPGAAYQNRVNGRVRLRCRIDVHGLAETCEIASETPQGHGFGKAALELRPTFKLPPTMGPDGPIAATKTIAIGFRAPRQPDLRKANRRDPGDEFGGARHERDHLRQQ